jgi:single-stranded-DNA-specific exonuclease
MSMNNSKRWEILDKAHGRKHKGIVDVLLENRGIKTKKDKKEFLEPILPENLSLKELGISNKAVKQAIDRIKKALKTKEKVIVYGDYDADGICGTAILWECLYSLGLSVLPHIPERFSEGYGLNLESLKKLKEEDPGLGLVITVDHGIVANEKVDVARELGLDVIITDHHQPGKSKPKAQAIIHTTQISGSAVAWILARELRKKSQVNIGLELVAIGTISDQLPLIGSNRSFAKYGLAALNKTKREGLLALFNEAVLVPGSIGPYEVGFMIAPRINAMGRLTHGIDSLRLLCTKDKTKARGLAMLLGKTNLERQKIVDEVVIHAREQIDGTKEGIIILAHESYHEGVIGLAAAKLVEEFYRPAIVLSRKKDISKASARSVVGFNIIETIRKLEGMYIEGGGHPMAAGFSIETRRVDAFAKKINEIAKPLLTSEILTRRLKIDMEVNLKDLNYELFKKLTQFEPTGLANPAPTFVSRKVRVVDAKVVGRDGRHLKLKVAQGEVMFEAIAFGNGALFSELSPDSQADIVFALEEDLWNGNQKLQLKIKDIRIN